MSELNKYGIGFWAGGGVYSLINMIENLHQTAQSKILIYNYIIFGAAIAGIIFNAILLRRKK